MTQSNSVRGPMILCIFFCCASIYTGKWDFSVNFFAFLPFQPYLHLLFNEERFWRYLSSRRRGFLNHRIRFHVENDLIILLSRLKGPKLPRICLQRAKIRLILSCRPYSKFSLTWRRRTIGYPQWKLGSNNLQVSRHRFPHATTRFLSWRSQTTS